MIRKDCGYFRRVIVARSPAGFVQSHAAVASAVWLLIVACSPAIAGSIRLWSTAVVMDDQVRLGEVCEVRGSDGAALAELLDLPIAEAPAPGGSRIIRLHEVRAALTGGGVNMAQWTLGGPTECAVTRPATILPAKSTRAEKGQPSVRADGPSQPRPSDADAPAASEPEYTLRRRIVEYFDGELARYGGSAEVAFDRDSESVLELGGPSYDFQIRRRGGPQLGLISLEIEVIADGRTLQTLPLVAQVALRRGVVVARRTISQEATITPADVEVLSLTFRRLDNLGMDDPAEAVGQRARRVVPAGSLIEPDMLEKVPLVLRGQLVTVTAISGSIQVVSAGKATQEGRLGDVIRIRCMDDQHVELDAIVTGPGEVRVGPRLKRSGEARLAAGEGP